MLTVFARISRHIDRAERKDDRLYLYSAALRYRLEPKNANILRVTVTKRDTFADADKPGVQQKDASPDWDFSETEERIFLNMKGLRIEIDRGTGAFTYLDADGKPLLRERDRESKCLEEFTAYRLAEGGKLEKEIVETADGKKEVIKSADRVEDEKLYHTSLHLCWQPNERLYGLGQTEEGFCDLCGKTVYVHQANRKIAVPLLVSSAGYGILMDTYSPMIFRDTEHGSYLYTEADREMDYYLINGEAPQGVIRGYRWLTGKASMLPKWAFGYLQSQERYETQEELLQTAEEYRNRRLGLDGVILDWCSWEDGKWGQKTLDHSRFPDLKEMTDKLHGMDVHFMISVWPNSDESCADHKELAEKGLLLPGSNVYNAFDPEGRRVYWEQLDRELFSGGTDAWWCDSSEPYTVEWNHVERPEPAVQFAEYCRETGDHIPAWQTNAFCLYHAMGIYEGQRNTMADRAQDTADGVRTGSGKRVFNLTRSAYTGQQRYGTVMWSGDTGASWETLRRQIGAGLSFSASGLPYWTADIGAFFVKTGEQWYWDGEYPDASEDLGYRELFVRWYQWGCFLPIFRGHGTDCRRELWNFGQAGEPFYEALVKMNRLRYQLMPYIYATAGKVWREDASFIHMLAFAFPQDEQAADCTDQYMFGEELLVCPVTEPMYYLSGSRKIEDSVKTRKVYLPAGQGWYDFWTNTRFEGGQWIEAPAELACIPLFVREGAVVPMAKLPKAEGSAAVSAAACREIEVRVYAGRDAECALYEDAGDGYAYERGDYCVRRLCWNEERQELLTVQEYGDPTADYLAVITGKTVIS